MILSSPFFYIYFYVFPLTLVLLIFLSFKWHLICVLFLHPSKWFISRKTCICRQASTTGSALFFSCVCLLKKKKKSIMHIYLVEPHMWIAVYFICKIFLQCRFLKSSSFCHSVIKCFLLVLYDRSLFTWYSYGRWGHNL